jgi:hypothetical protein
MLVARAFCSRAILALMVAGLARPAPADADPPAAHPVQPVATNPGGEQPTPTFAPASNIDEAFLHLQVAIGMLNDRATFNAGIDSEATAELNRQINELQDLFGDAREEPDADYAQSLDFAATTIMAAASEADVAAASRALALLRRDFRVKIATARATLGATGNPPDTILVTVTTQRAGRAVRGYIIRAAAALYPRAPPIYGFANPTNPSTSRRLVPGIYLLHAYDSNGRESCAISCEFEIGLDGGDAARVTLVVR